MLQTTTIDDRLEDFPIVDYGVETVTCDQKYEMWMREGFSEVQDMIKSVLLAYQKGEQEHYILACTTGKSEIDFAEIAYELSLSDEEAGTLTARLFDDEIEEITGKRRGEVSPRLDEDKLEGLDAVYFTRELMRASEKVYDVPLSLKESILISADELFAILKEGSGKYKTFSHEGSYRSSESEEPAENFKFSVLDSWEKVKEEGERLSFYGTKISHDGQTYILKQPRTRKTDSRSRREGCIAVLVDEHGRDVKREDGRKHRIIIPACYEDFEKMYNNHLFRKRSADWFNGSN